MPKRHITFTENTFVHIFNRGVNKMTIFKDVHDYNWFLNKMQKLNFYNIFRVISYCLMPNHFHFYLIIKTDDSVSILFQRLQLAYAKYFNNKYDHSGHLYENNFKSVHVNKEEHAIYLSKYIHLNPVKAGLVNTPELWKYSNYIDIINRKTEKFYNYFYKSYFHSPKGYIDFVNDNLDDYDIVKDYLFD